MQWSIQSWDLIPRGLLTDAADYVPAKWRWIDICRMALVRHLEELGAPGVPFGPVGPWPVGASFARRDKLKHVLRMPAINVGFALARPPRSREWPTSGAG